MTAPSSLSGDDSYQSLAIKYQALFQFFMMINTPTTNAGYIVSQDGKRGSDRFVDEERLERAVERAKESLESNPHHAESSVLIYDGFITLGEWRSDALFLDIRRWGSTGWRLSMALRRQGVRVQEFPYANSSSSKFLPRSYSHTLEVGGGQRYDPEENAPVAVQAGQEYVVNLDVEGEGFIRVWMWQLTTPDEPTRKADLIGDFVLSPTVPALHFQRRIRTEDEVAFVRIAIERYGISSLTLKQAYLEELDSRGALR